LVPGPDMSVIYVRRITKQMRLNLTDVKTLSKHVECHDVG